MVIKTAKGMLYSTKKCIIGCMFDKEINRGRNYDDTVERKGSFDCDMEYIPRQAISSGTFKGVPNCVDHLKYYRVELIYDSK